MTGIRYITDEKGHKTDIVISLEEHLELIEDFLDALLIEDRKNEESVSLEDFITELKDEGKLDV
jgi:hypothetical protein